jgi:hypothetical protein
MYGTMYEPPQGAEVLLIKPKCHVQRIPSAFIQYGTEAMLTLCNCGWRGYSHSRSIVVATKRALEKAIAHIEAHNNPISPDSFSVIPSVYASFDAYFRRVCEGGEA